MKVLDINDDDALVRLQTFLELDATLTNHHKNTSRSDLKSGKLFEALRLEYDVDLSKQKVEQFLKNENLEDARNEKLCCHLKSKSELKSRVSLRPPISLIRFLVARRANSRSFIGTYLLDQFIGLFRVKSIEMNRFISIRRYSSGAK